MSTFGCAVVCAPAASFAGGLTQASLGAPDLQLAQAQHADYCRALADAGLALVWLPPDPRFPDSTFVEDTAIVTARGAILTRPGAASRAGETATIAAALDRLGVPQRVIEPPGTVDGGDVCEVEGQFLIGLSGRTNGEGARQLGRLVAEWGYGWATIDVRPFGSALLHLKSGLSELGDGRLAVVEELAGHCELARWELVVVEAAEAYAANCVRVNDRVLVAAGHPRFATRLAQLGYRVHELDVSEFRKMDGGLSCLSLRLPRELAPVTG